MSENRHVKMFVLNFLVGAGFFLTSLITTMMIGGILGTPLRGTVDDLGTAVGTLNPALALSVVVSFIVSGSLVWLWAKSRIWIGKGILHIDNIGHEPTVNTNKKVGLILTIIAVGIITSVIMVGFNGFIGKFNPNANLADPSTLVTAIMKYDLMLLVSVLLTIGILGAIVTMLGHWIHPIQQRIDKTPLT